MFRVMWYTIHGHLADVGQKRQKKWGERMVLFYVLLQSLYGNMLKQAYFVAEVQYFYGERMSCN